MRHLTWLLVAMMVVAVVGTAAKAQTAPKVAATDNTIYFSVGFRSHTLCNQLKALTAIFKGLQQEDLATPMMQLASVTKNNIVASLKNLKANARRDHRRKNLGAAIKKIVHRLHSEGKHC